MSRTWLALIAVVGAILLAVGRVDAERSVIDWVPAAGAPAVALPLAAAEPESLSVRYGCDAVRAASSPQAPIVVFSSTGSQSGGDGLRLLGQSDASGAVRAWVEFDGDVIQGSTILLGEGCEAAMDYWSDGQRLVVGSGEKRVETRAQRLTAVQSPLTQSPPIVAGLYAAPELAGVVSVETTTMTTGHDAAGWRVVVGLVVGASVLGLLLSLLGGARRRRADESALASPRWTLSDTVVSVFAGMALVLSLPNFDDGWVLTTVRQFDELGMFSNYFSARATAQPQGYWWEWLSRAWLDSTSTPGFLLRLPAALLVVWTWWFLRRRVLDQCVAEQRVVARMCAASVYVAGASSLLISLRFEVVVAALLAVMIALVMRYARQPDSWVLGVMAVVAALGVSLHQTGWSVVLAGLACLPAVLRDRPQRDDIVAVLAIGASAGLALLMLGTNVWLWRDGVSGFMGESRSAYGGWLDEFQRLGAVPYGFGSVPARLFFIAVLALALVGYLTRAGRVVLVHPSGAAGLAAGLSLAGLLLTSSKYPIHLGAVVPAVAVLVAIAVADLEVPGAGPARRIAALVGVIVAAGFALSRVWVMTPGSQESAGAPGVGGGFGPWWLWVLLLAAGAVAVWARLGSRWAIGAVAAASSLLVVAASWGPSVAQAGDPASWVSQVRAGLTGDTCGLGDVVEVPTQVSPLEQLGEGGGELVQVPTAVPLAGVTGLAPRLGQSGRVATAWYDVADVPGGAASFWARSRMTFDAVSLEVEFADGVSGTSARALPRSSDGDRWMAYTVDVPPGVQRMRLTWHTGVGPLAVTPPVAVTRSEPLSATVGPVWNNPQTYLQDACLAQPSIATGVFEPFERSLGPLSFNGTAVLANATGHQLVCPVERLEAALRCVYGYTRSPANPGLTVRPDAVRTGWF